LDIPEEYWLEYFRKTVLVEIDGNRLLIDYDVYSRKGCEELGCNVTTTIDMGDITVKYCELPVSSLVQASKYVSIDDSVIGLIEKLVLVALEYKCDNNRCWEIVNARVVMEKPKDTNVKDIVENFYKILVKYLEDRDVDSQPLYSSIDVALQ